MSQTPFHRPGSQAEFAKHDWCHPAADAIASELQMTNKRPVDGRLYNGIRRIEVSLPVALVVELDLHIAEFGYWISRSSVIEKAIRRFLDDGGIGVPSPGPG